MDDVARIDQELRAEMVEAQAQVARFTTEHKQAVDTIALQATRTLENDKENLRAKTGELEQISSADSSLQQRTREEQARLEELRRELETLTAQESMLPPEQQRLTKALEQQRQLLAQRELAFHQCQLQKEQKLSELQKGCEMYRAMLGLEFERVGDERLRLIFTNIDERAPSRTFSFQVFVDKEDHYHIEDCEPAVPALPKLMEKLNHSNDFSAFVRAMRGEFKKL